MEKSYEDLFYSIGIGISLATMIVSVLKMFTQYYFYYLVLLLICALAVLFFLHQYHITEQLVIWNDMRVENNDASKPGKLSKSSDWVNQGKNPPRRKVAALHSLSEINSYFRRRKRQKNGANPDDRQSDENDVEFHQSDDMFDASISDDTLSISSIEDIDVHCKYGRGKHMTKMKTKHELLTNDCHFPEASETSDGSILLSTEINAQPTTEYRN